MSTECNHCEHGKNCLNGRYCKLLNIYVEYKHYSPCKETQHETEY
nr:MAG TPA: hypothetical protein [Caudoviricetes sp.]